MQARDIMSSPAITVKLDAPADELAKTLLAYKIGAVPVVDDFGSLVGIVAEGDLLSIGQAREGRAASDVMTKDVVTAEAETEVSRIAELLVEHGITSVPVIRGDRVIGMVARRDLLKVLARNDDHIHRQLATLFDGSNPRIGQFEVDVADGKVTLKGTADEEARRVAALVARSIPGVVSIDFA